MSEKSSSAGYALLESVVALALLAVAALGLAEGLGHALRLAEDAVLRLREASLREALAADGVISATGWQPATSTGGAPCWRRATRPAAGWVWIEVRCGVEAAVLPAGTRAPGLLVFR